MFAKLLKYWDWQLQLYQNILQSLKKAGFIEDFKDGKWINYSLKKAISEPEVYSLFSYLYFILENDLKIKEDRTKLGFVDRIEIKKDNSLIYEIYKCLTGLKD